MLGALQHDTNGLPSPGGPFALWRTIQGIPTPRNYAEYLASPQWKARRMSVGRKAKWTCSCGRRATQIHHRTYERLGKERPSDLHAVCDPCHAEIHRLERAGMPLADATDAILATIGEAPRLSLVAMRRLSR